MPNEDTLTELTLPKANEKPPTVPEHDVPPAPLPEPLTEKESELAAAVVHEAMMGYGRARGHNNTASWDDSPEWQKEQARSAVRNAIAGTSGAELPLLVARAVVEFLEMADAR